MGKTYDRPSQGSNTAAPWARRYPLPANRCGVVAPHTDW